MRSLIHRTAVILITTDGSRRPIVIVMFYSVIFSVGQERRRLWQATAADSPHNPRHQIKGGP